ncbi:hypothetical protein BS50DRAFT_264922 [Corynespora cassiicola Philippines]|uniref:Uncharacterized protein n=1 Tax=Corynespora cassiicola Philippines TaxID=1448308 RepID=A0A2T2NZU8_CORCC|nr:hypothetical protein BS50DRAFT_264922 [Corynespora cassiicola Philippines]
MGRRRKATGSVGLESYPVYMGRITATGYGLRGQPCKWRGMSLFGPRPGCVFFASRGRRFPISSQDTVRRYLEEKTLRNEASGAYAHVMRPWRALVSVSENWTATDGGNGGTGGKATRRPSKDGRTRRRDGEFPVPDSWTRSCNRRRVARVASRAPALASGLWPLGGCAHVMRPWRTCRIGGKGVGPPFGPSAAG